MKRILAILLFVTCILTMTLFASANTDGKAELGDLLEKSYDPSLYTPESFAAYQAAASNALGVYNDPAATTEQIDDVLAQLKQSEEGLNLLLNTEKLLTFASDLEQEFIYNNNLVLPEELLQDLTSACEEFRTLYSNGTVTAENILQAEEKFNTLIEEAEEVSMEAKPFSANNPEESVVIPENFEQAQKNTSGKVTQLRTTLVIIGSVFLILGVIAATLYFKPPKFLK